MAPSSSLTMLKETQASESADSENSWKGLEEERGFGNQNYKFFIWEFNTPLIWNSVIIMALLHILTVWSFLTYPYCESVGTIFYAIAIAMISGFGATAGAHRYWSHKTFKAKLPLRIILLFCYSMTGQNSLKKWVRDHRVHHKFSETDADPHNAKRGFFFAHMGWLMMKKHPEVLRRGSQIDCNDIFQDPLVVYHQKYFSLLKLLCCFILPTIIPPLLWHESWMASIKAVTIARYCLALHCIWLVNSAAHLWGNKPYNNTICPVENLPVSFLAMGEGYHNYHHTFPWDYKASEFSVILNPTTCFIDFFYKIGWAYDLKAAPLDLVKKVIENKGDGSHFKWGQEIPEEHIKFT